MTPGAASNLPRVGSRHEAEDRPSARHDRSRAVFSREMSSRRDPPGLSPLADLDAARTRPPPPREHRRRGFLLAVRPRQGEPVPVWQPRRDVGSAAPRGGGASGASRAGARNQLRSRRHAGALSRPPCQRFPLVVYPPLAHFPHPRARRLTPRSRSELAEEGLARARRGALRRVADGGGVLLRRQVRWEGAVRFPVESSALQREIPPPRVPFRENDPNTTPRKPLTVPAPFTRTGRNSSSASTRFPRCTRSSLARRPQSPRRTKSPPPWCRYASLPDSPLPKSRRMSCFAHSSLPPVCLTPSLSSAASREKASHGELAESRGDQETLPGVHLESRREPGAP